MFMLFDRLGFGEIEAGKLAQTPAALFDELDGAFGRISNSARRSCRSLRNCRTFFPAAISFTERFRTSFTSSLDSRGRRFNCARRFGNRSSRMTCAAIGERSFPGWRTSQR